MLLTDDRKAALASEPLQVQEVLQGLSKMRPPSQDSIDALDAWCQKLLEPPKPKVWLSLAPEAHYTSNSIVLEAQASLRVDCVTVIWL